MKDEILNRQKANLKIADILMGSVWEQKFGWASELKKLANKYPQQRAGQLICNYICDDYRSSTPTVYTKAFLAQMFPGNPDPFFEESVTTLKRLTDR